MKITPAMLPLGPFEAGHVHQIYMGAGRSVDAVALAKICKRDKAMGVKHAVLHYGPRRAVDVFAKHSQVVIDSGMKCSVSFGLDGHEDDATHHHDVLTATEKGECMAQVALHPNASSVGQDAEPAYDPGVPSSDGAIDASLTVKVFRQHAPNAFVWHQPWWKPSVHRRFPYKTFALGAEAVFPQTYFNNAETVQTYGKKRYRTLLPVYEHEWSTLEAGFQSTVGTDDPRGETYQSYGWDDIPHEFVRISLHTPIIILWGEPEISLIVEACIRAIGILHSEGFVNPDTAVIEWQRAWNKSESGRRIGKITEDNALGYQSLRAMGLVT